MKTCNRCEIEKALEEFDQGTGAQGRVSMCKPCKAEYMRERNNVRKVCTVCHAEKSRPMFRKSGDGACKECVKYGGRSAYPCTACGDSKHVTRLTEGLCTNCAETLPMQCVECGEIKERLRMTGNTCKACYRTKYYTPVEKPEPVIITEPCVNCEAEVSVNQLNKGRCIPCHQAYRLILRDERRKVQHIAEKERLARLEAERLARAKRQAQRPPRPRSKPEQDRDTVWPPKWREHTTKSCTQCRRMLPLKDYSRGSDKFGANPVCGVCEVCNALS